MKGEFWDLMEVEVNDRGEKEVNIWARGIADIKNAVKRRVARYMWNDSWIGRWDLFAYEVYKNQYLWWVVPVVNDILNPFVEPASGAIVEVPDLMDVWEYIKFRGK